MPPAKAAPLAGFFANKPPCGIPRDATVSPSIPRGALCPPARAGQPGKRDLPPRPSLSAGFTWMGRFICNTQAGAGGQRPFRACREPFPRGRAGFGPSLAQGAGVGSGGGPCKNRAGPGGRVELAMLWAEGDATAPGTGTRRRPPDHWCQPWPPARFPRLQRTAEAAAAPSQPRPGARSPFPNSPPISASSHAPLPRVPVSVTHACSGTRWAGAHVPGPLPHGAISPPLSPSFSPSFSRKMLQLRLFPQQQACFPRDAAESKPCARWGRHGNGGMSRVTGRVRTHTYMARARTGTAVHTRAAVTHRRGCAPTPGLPPHPRRGSPDLGAEWGQR